MDSFNSKSKLKSGGKEYTVWSLDVFQKAGIDISRLPFSIKILLENLLRTEDGKAVSPAEIEALAKWKAKEKSEQEINFTPARVILQDFTGVPCVVDLAAMRDQMLKISKDPKKINPLQPVDLVIDHSVQVDAFGTTSSLQENTVKEFERNLERYEFLRWGQQAFRNFRAVPPGTGIVHQVNLEYLAPVVMTRQEGSEENAETLAYPDTLVGTDSHTVMINGLGVLGWGVGGIEAEAAMLGQPVSMLIPEVVGFKFTGKLKEGVTATDLVLTVTQILRKKGVVGKFVEFFGVGLSQLSLADRATIANMAPEYGATMGFFPVDEESLNYLRLSNRSAKQVKLVEDYYKAQGLFRTDATLDPEFSDCLELDLSTVEPSLAGPKRPQDRVTLKNARKSFDDALTASGKPVATTVNVQVGAEQYTMKHGNVVIAAITSCTNTSNPAVMLGAGILAKKAVEKGLTTKPWVKSSLAPGSKVVMEYLDKTELTPYLEKLKFNLVGYGCTTCIGNSGPLPDAVSKAVKDSDLVVAAVLSGNRNFEGRVNPQVRANYLASPPLVVAYALAGDMGIDLTAEPLGQDPQGNAVYLKDIWPTDQEVRDAVSKVSAEMFDRQYKNVFEGDKYWQAVKFPSGDRFIWDEKSTYVRKPPYFDGMPAVPAQIKDIKGARVLAVLGDSVTTDHISPAGNIAKDSPAAKYLISHGVEAKDFNSYGARRGNHEVMMRGTFANIRLKNFLLPGVEGPYTKYFNNSPSPNVFVGDHSNEDSRLTPCGNDTSPKMFIFDAAMKYQEKKTPLIIIAGKEYGSGSSRDWAAKGPMLLGVRAVIAESFERIHRSNLIGMGILPLEFEAGQNRETVGLTGEEVYSIEGVANQLAPGKKLLITAGDKKLTVRCRIDTPVELAYYQHGGILQYVLRSLAK